MTRWVDPAAIFLDSTDAISCPSVSRSSARSTRMRMSSAGLSLTAPPHTTHPPSRSTTRRIAAVSSRRRHGLHGVGGSRRRRDRPRRCLRHHEAERSHDATMSGVVRLPGSPPAQCLSTRCRPAIEPFARLHHRVGQREHFLVIERPGGAGGEKGRQMDVGILAVHDVADDGVERRFAEIVAVDAAADVTRESSGAGWVTVMRSPSVSPSRVQADFDKAASSCAIRSPVA